MPASSYCLRRTPDPGDWIRFVLVVGVVVSAEGHRAPAAELPPIKPAWEISTLPEEDAKRAALDKHLNQDKERAENFMPSFVPLLVDGKVIYRSFQGVRVDNLRLQGKPEWWSWLDGGVRSLTDNGARWPTVARWRIEYSLWGEHHLLFENSLLGNASTDGTFVYVVDDLAILPHPELCKEGNRLRRQFGALQEMVDHNTLKAYELRTGKLSWELGGNFDRGPLKGNSFLGPPLPLAGSLFVLTEKKGELSLVGLKPQPFKEVKLASGAVKKFPQAPIVVRSQKLLTAERPFDEDMPRRAQVAFVSYSDGVLFCTTNAGIVAGVDLVSHKLLWTFRYRPEKTEAPIGKSWKAAPPATRDGKVVFTAPDGDAVHCLNLRDGKPLWKAERGDGIYLAGIFNDRVLVVSRGSCRILALADGKELAKLATGIPSGQGVPAGNRYYLPLREGSDSKAPEIAVVDVAKGAIATRFPLANRQVPGNLAIGPDEIVSQTMTRIASFPQLKIPPQQLGRPLQAEELRAIWTSLGDEAVRPSINAGWLLATVPDQAIPFLKQRVTPIPVPDATRLARLIRDLDDNRFPVRFRATEDLAALEDAAEEALRKALAAKPPLEMKRRLEDLLQRLEHHIPTPDQLRALRAVEILRTINTPAARGLLKDLAAGAPSARLTRIARAALDHPDGKSR